MLTQKVGFKKKLINTTSFYHKEEQSSEASFQNKSEVKQKYEMDSSEWCVELFDMEYQEVLSKYFRL